MTARTRWKKIAAAAGFGDKARRRRRERAAPPPPPVTTQSSPGQIADLEQAYGAAMAPPSPSGEQAADG